jgi:GTP cyclohydrolase IA
MLVEMTAGYNEDPETILATTFSDHCDEVVVLKGITFTSLCEHHLLPFVGTADVGYLPDGMVVGISKLARLVNCFARRLQVQERMTQQIAQSIETWLHARGAAVVIRARHQCLACRGANQPQSEMVTSAMLGLFRSDTALRAEFLHLVN